MVLRGASLARERYPQLEFIFVGDEHKIRPIFNRIKLLQNCSEILHTDVYITADMKPSLAIRVKDSSMRKALDEVSAGRAQAMISAGNTGALMAVSKLALRMLPGVDRPAMAALVPTDRGESVVLDLGANTECEAHHLIQFSLMGSVFIKTILGITQATVGLLNIGSEETKGREEIRKAAEIMRSSPMPFEFCGFVEGNDIMVGKVDVVVADGFTGNVALKALEGSAKFVFQAIRQAFRSSLMARIGYVVAKHAMKKMRIRLDPRRYNGAVFLGLNGIAVKSHGGADPIGFANAIGVAADMVIYGFMEKTAKEIEALASIMAEHRTSSASKIVQL